MNSESGRQFPAFEATSLQNKFKQLWLAGIQAKLVFETHAGHAWGTLHVCLGEHPGHHQQPPHSQEVPPSPSRHISPARQRRKARREAARAVAEAAAIAAENKEDEAEKASESDNPNEVDDEIANSNEGQVAADEAETDHTAEDTETVSKVKETELFVTDVDDEICSDEEYYQEIDPSEAFTCFQCKMEHYPDNHVYSEGEKVKMYGLCRWHLGVSRCKNCAKNLIGLGTIRVHRQICRAPS